MLLSAPMLGKPKLMSCLVLPMCSAASEAAGRFMLGTRLGHRLRCISASTLATTLCNPVHGSLGSVLWDINKEKAPEAIW